MPRYRVNLERAFRFANELSRYNARLRTEAYRPGRELLFAYDGPIEEARDAIVDIFAIALSDALEPAEFLVEDTPARE